MFQDVFQRAKEDIQQENDRKIQQETTRLGNFVEARISSFATELSAGLASTREDLNKKLDDIVEANLNMKRSVQEVGDRVTQIERTLKHC